MKNTDLLHRLFLFYVHPINHSGNTEPSPTPITDPNYRVDVSSKQAILASGISEPYFKQHFSLASSRQTVQGQVVWKYTIGDWELQFDDEIDGGFDDNGQYSETHSIANDFRGIHEFSHLLSKAEVMKIAQTCLAPFHRNLNQLVTSVEYEPSVNNSIPTIEYGGFDPDFQTLSAPGAGGGTGFNESFSVNLETGKCVPFLTPR